MAVTDSAVALVLGSHTWADTADDSPRVDQILDVARRHGVDRIDTARAYGLGASETAIGNKALPAEFAVYTKAATGVIAGSGRRENILASAEQSLEALKTTKIPLFFLHAPDPTVPVDEQMDAIQHLYLQGAFSRFGLSNFTVDQVREYHAYAVSKGYVLPTVYQSSYSLAIRLNEERLFPALRELGFSIQAYSPMAAGLLAKTPEYILEGRGSWDPKTVSGQVYRHMYLKDSYLEMLKRFGDLSEKSGVSRSGLAYRWVRYHSALKGDLGDEMIVGAATPDQLEETLKELEKGPLEDWVAKKIEELWELIRADAPVDNLEAVRKAAGSTL